MTSLRAVSATADGVAFEYGEGLETEAAREASLYCANLGRRAELRQVTHQGGFGVSAFDCR